MKKNNQIIILSSIGALILIATMSIFLLNKAKINIAQASKPTVERVDPYKNDIEFYQSMLQSTNLPSEAATYYQRRLNIIGYAATQRSAGLTAIPYITITIPPRPTDVIGFKLPDGIDNHPGFSFRQNVFRVVNEWRKTTPNHFYAVFAGYLNDDDQQGAVYVLQPNLAFNLYISPDRRGSVRVIAENDTTITLESTDGTLFYFDAATEQFVDAQGTPFPPTPTPFNSSPSTPIPYP
jgi:hypothetical protein